jgi:UDP-4-amino-4,6-dideoxy-N-acetyl-beta-L-altrosamine transaminase
VSPAATYLPYGRHQIEQDDIDAVSTVLRGDWLTTGPAVESFESALADHVSAPEAVACSSGTAALHLAALALDIQPGERVVVPTETFVATANAIRYVGGEVVFADCDPATGLMRPQDLSTAIDRARAGAGGNGRLRAVFPVHLAGQSEAVCEMADVAAGEDLAIVEDASHAIGSIVTNGGEEQPIGSCLWSTMAVFSMHPVKTVAMGEGGAITTRSTGLAARLRTLRTHGLVRTRDAFVSPKAFAPGGEVNPWYYELHELGFNYRASDINCALGLSQLRKLSRFVKRRRALVERYDHLIAGTNLSPVLRPLSRVPSSRPAWHLYVILVDFAELGLDRAAVMQWLKARGIGTQVHYIPVHRQPYYEGRYGAIDLPGADAYYDRCLSLPLFPGMTDTDVDRVVEALADVVRKR